MCMLRWMCGFNLKDRKNNMKHRKLLGLESVSMSIRRGRLQWFGCVEHKDDADWVKRRLTEIEET